MIKCFYISIVEWWDALQVYFGTTFGLLIETGF